MAVSRDHDAQAAAVTIFGQTYHLRGDENGEYLEQLAGLVDRKMRDVAEATETADTLKVAILASLNLADEYLQARRGEPAREDERIDERLARMVTMLDEALVE